MIVGSLEQTVQLDLLSCKPLAKSIILRFIVLIMPFNFIRQEVHSIVSAAYSNLRNQLLEQLHIALRCL
jgi:hypothetical protein